MCANQTNLDQVKVRDIFKACDLRVCEMDKMQDVGNLLTEEGWDLLPVYDYSHKYVGILDPLAFVQFQDNYFENLKFGDRGNEFVFECDDENSGIHFVPIDQISRYTNRDVPAVSADDTLAEAKELILNNKVNAIPVADKDGKVIGTISLRDIVRSQGCQGKGKCGGRNSKKSAMI